MAGFQRCQTAISGSKMTSAKFFQFYPEFTKKLQIFSHSFQIHKPNYKIHFWIENTSVPHSHSLSLSLRSLCISFPNNPEDFRCFWFPPFIPRNRCEIIILNVNSRSCRQTVPQFSRFSHTIGNFLDLFPFDKPQNLETFKTKGDTTVQHFRNITLTIKNIYVIYSDISVAGLLTNGPSLKFSSVRPSGRHPQGWRTNKLILRWWTYATRSEQRNWIKSARAQHWIQNTLQQHNSGATGEISCQLVVLYSCVLGKLEWGRRRTRLKSKLSSF